MPEKSAPRRGAEPPGSSRWLVWALLATLSYLALRPFWAPGPEGTPVSYSQLRQEIASDNVLDVTMQGRDIRGTLREPIPQVQGGRHRPGDPVPLDRTCSRG